jgi:hypothetical protein
MEQPSFPLLGSHDSEAGIVFKGHYINIHTESKDTIENSIIPYSSICTVDEQHLREGMSQLRRINIHLICGRTRVVETNNSEHAEQILLHLLRNTMQPRMNNTTMTSTPTAPTQATTKDD